jgi:hypothetical protein
MTLGDAFGAGPVLAAHRMLQLIHKRACGLQFSWVLPPSAPPSPGVVVYKTLIESGSHQDFSFFNTHQSGARLLGHRVSARLLS